MSRYSICIDVTKCTGCYNCFLSCRDEYCGNDYPNYSASQPIEDHFWMRVNEIETGAYPKPRLCYIPLPCQHCADAPCIEAAEAGAVYRRADGIVMIDPEKCKGQEAIVKACPYRVIFWNAEKQIAQKCTLCAHRLDQGEKQPRCVESYPTGALVFGDLDDPNSEIARLGAKCEDLHPEFETAPLVKYIGIPKRCVAGEVVLGDRQGECAAGAAVTLEGAGLRLETATDVFGDFEFEGLGKNQAYRLTFSHSGYKTKKVDVVTQADVVLAEVVLEPSK